LKHSVVFKQDFKTEFQEMTRLTENDKMQSNYDKQKIPSKI